MGEEVIIYFIHSLMHSFSHSFILSFSHSFMHSSIHQCTHSFIDYANTVPHWPSANITTPTACIEQALCAS